MESLDDLYLYGRASVIGGTGSGKSNEVKVAHHGVSVASVAINPTAKRLGGSLVRSASQIRGLLARKVQRIELMVGETSSPEAINADLQVLKDLIVEFGTKLMPSPSEDAPVWLLVCCEEAHNYCPNNAPRDNVVKWLLAEGRKYGVRVLVSSQKLQKLDKDAISEANFIIVYQLLNAGDTTVKYLKGYKVPYGEFEHLLETPYHHVIVRNGKWVHCLPGPNMDGVL